MRVLAAVAGALSADDCDTASSENGIMNTLNRDRFVRYIHLFYGMTLAALPVASSPLVAEMFSANSKLFSNRTFTNTRVSSMHMENISLAFPAIA